MVKKYIVLIIVGVVFMVNASYGISQDEKNFLHACRYGQMYVIEELIDKVNINVQDEEEGYTPLMNAIREREIEIVKILLEHNADVTKIKDNSGRNAFFWAAVLDELEMLKLFEKYNPDYNESDNYGSNALFFTRKAETVNYLLKNGADINKKNKSGRTPLIQHSLAYENQDHVKFLLEKGADINAQDNEGVTTLMFAVQTDKTKIIDICLSEKADINIKDNEGKTALFHTISSFGILENVKSMTENMFGDYARTDYVKNYMNQKKMEETDTAIRLIKLLVSNGADINAQDNKGNTLLMYAIALRNEPLINEILKLNPDVNIKNKEGKTANDIAKEYGYKIVK
ncbi:ankyrin repeat domain-containing protein [Brachyspira hyodysenteriae]|uniref:ankyrin repeat domain-containing protein n=2 Tax=Brachyspira hyodysenteriae TaxID=159 RepID=UPI0022CD678B|nr:ankyrin repeat domain-containing protein [Brachyspira hyodysenteriae]MCZ9889698.1 ankyrin repeat domain-containing protein [Brachyspira hyodysenteriae]MDA0035140.1 ankyrin repeat domain-containing protein [Brachyspira hyodysenteriae]MDA0049228.1 ankyrin repeat domain-containing protein [Brachyspira hyodysenteriae]MDA1468412.1 ankyrin repeat domain-containing protein [Brachyspira hyodysenteriae]